MKPLFALVAVAASWDTASTLCRRTGAEPVKQLVSRCFVCAASFLAVFHVLGFLQLLGAWPIVRLDLVAALAVTLAGAARLVLPRESAQAPLPARLALWPRGLRHVAADPALMLVGLGALIVHALLIASVLSAPPRGFDALWYHLPNALHWYQSASFAPLVGSYVEFYPGNGELLALPFLSLTNDSWIGLAQYPWFVLTALIAALLAERSGAAPRAIRAVGLTVLTMPLLVYQAMQLYVDLYCAALALGTLLYLIDWRRQRGAADLLLCLLTASLLIGTKYVAVFAWLFPIAVLLVSGARRRDDAPGTTPDMRTLLVLVCGLGTAFTWLWWARNTAATLNPIAPVHVGFMWRVLLSGQLLSSVFGAPGSGSLRGVIDEFLAAYGGFILIGPTAIALAVWQLRRRPRMAGHDVMVMSVTYIAWCGITFVVFLTYDPRFVIAAVVMSLVLFAAATRNAERAAVRVLFLVASVNAGLAAYEIAFADNFAVSINRLSRNQYYGLPDEIDRLPGAARVLLRGHPALVYPAAGAQTTNVVVPSPMGAVQEEVERWDIDYVLARSANPAEIEGLGVLPFLRPIQIVTLPRHHWWDYWPERQAKVVGLFEVVK